MTEGRRALLRILLRTRAAYIAARLRVTPRTVYRWAEGYRRPSERSKKLLEVNYGIARDLWTIGRSSNARQVR